MFEASVNHSSGIYNVRTRTRLRLVVDLAFSLGIHPGLAFWLGRGARGGARGGGGGGVLVSSRLVSFL